MFSILAENKYSGHIQQTEKVMFLVEKLSRATLLRSEGFSRLNIPNPPDREESGSRTKKIVRLLAVINRPYG